MSQACHVSMNGRPLRGKEGVLEGCVLVFRDLTRLKQASAELEKTMAELRYQSELMDTTFRSISDGIVVADAEGKFLYVNPGAQHIVGMGITGGPQEEWAETYGTYYPDRETPMKTGDLPLIRAIHRGESTDEEDLFIRNQNDPQGRKARLFIIELSQSFSMWTEEVRKTVGRVRDRANHIADIVLTQRAFSPTMARKDIDLRDALSGAVRVLRDSLNKRGIHTGIDCENAPREIRIQESQFHQMLVNLVKNSMEAIDDLAADQRLDETPHIRIKACAQDGFLNLEVSDNGIGIKNKDAKLIFAPGYTTKRSGSGLGLHSAANFVIASGGRIQASSEGTGKGATILVRFSRSPFPWPGSGTSNGSLPTAIKDWKRCSTLPKTAWRCTTRPDTWSSPTRCTRSS